MPQVELSNVPPISDQEFFILEHERFCAFKSSTLNPTVII